MDESIKYSRISWIIAICATVSSYFIPILLRLPEIMIVIWESITFIAYIVGIIFGIKGIKAGKQNGNKSAVKQGKVGLVLNSSILGLIILGYLVGILIFSIVKA